MRTMEKFCLISSDVNIANFKSKAVCLYVCKDGDIVLDAGCQATVSSFGKANHSQVITIVTLDNKHLPCC